MKPIALESLLTRLEVVQIPEYQRLDKEYFEEHLALPLHATMQTAPPAVPTSAPTEMSRSPSPPPHQPSASPSIEMSNMNTEYPISTQTKSLKRSLNEVIDLTEER